MWLDTVYGGAQLFDAKMYPISESSRGNRFAIRPNRKVVDLDDVRSLRWPRECLQLHRFSCSETFDDTRARVWTARRSPGKTRIPGADQSF